LRALGLPGGRTIGILGGAAGERQRDGELGADPRAYAGMS
jgi:hypothetical protein